MYVMECTCRFSSTKTVAVSPSHRFELVVSADRYVPCGLSAQVLHWFEHNQPVVDASGLLPRDYSAEAKALACSLLEEQCGTVALFLTDMAQVIRVSRDLGGPCRHAGSLCACKWQKKTACAAPSRHSAMRSAADTDVVP